MIDFDALVLGPCHDLLARPVTITPKVSQPGAPAYGARGIWKSTPVDVAILDGGVLGTQDHKLDIRASEFAVLPVQGDECEIPAAPGLVRIGLCRIEGADDDGQGGTRLDIKVIGP